MADGGWQMADGGWRMADGSRRHLAKPLSCRQRSRKRRSESEPHAERRREEAVVARGDRVLQLRVEDSRRLADGETADDVHAGIEIASIGIHERGARTDPVRGVAAEADVVVKIGVRRNEPARQLDVGIEVEAVAEGEDDVAAK